MARENEPNRIVSGENVFNWDHSQIENAFSDLDPGDAYRMAQSYAKAATEWDQGLETFKRSVNNSIAEAWEGQAAEQAKNSIKAYTDHAADLTDLLSSLSLDIDAAGTTIANTKKAIPPAAAHSWTTHIWPPRAAEEERSRSKVTSDSRDAMQHNYVAGFSGFDHNVPKLPPALNPTQPGDGRIPGTGPGDTSGPDGPDGTDAPKPDGGQDGSDAKTPGEDTPQDPNSQDRPAASPNGDSAATTPSGTNPGANTAPAGVDPHGPSTTPSGLPGGGLHSGGLGGGPAPGGPGRSIPGIGVPGVAGTPAAAASGRPGAGTAGMPGMGVPGNAGKGKDEDEKTHKTADYLVNSENAAELLGELSKALPGGVIDGDLQDDDRHSSE
ncbi:hypothetical protein NONO_c62970 [Nocardia nova SH22a]|uniref:Outer membrane channel protein CpnT-like N-terminal domain-containing protein n=1 Tax=Nocardia nova SH22a TaxID=1415166 RepID=W5TP85_9NOCA|nr:WXG100 family type VII secretion target [Nocardia nova]AHH21067.1 hypothetical protein NONO_c62970 [Nocardia nova SH22a]